MDDIARCGSGHQSLKLSDLVLKTYDHGFRFLEIRTCQLTPGVTIGE
jgi:hypothetical protein